MATKSNNNKNKKTKEIKLVRINNLDKNNNHKNKKSRKIEDDPQQRIEEFRSRPWLEAEINELTEKVNENNDIIMRHEKLLLMMEFVYEEKRTKENKDLIINIKKVIESHQNENNITNMVLTLYQGFLKKLDN